MEVIERDKSCTDEELRKTKLNTSLELEEMKKEINVLQRQLGQAQIVCIKKMILFSIMLLVDFEFGPLSCKSTLIDFAMN